MGRSGNQDISQVHLSSAASPLAPAFADYKSWAMEMILEAMANLVSTLAMKYWLVNQFALYHRHLRLAEQYSLSVQPHLLREAGMSHIYASWYEDLLEHFSVPDKVLEAASQHQWASWAGAHHNRWLTTGSVAGEQSPCYILKGKIITKYPWGCCQMHASLLNALQT